ncbi:MAG: MBL fold metallo-hydrolase [Candidatus Delongbacteria bacterium]|nr:MBL fold metallo-hydrolase [Candidatus Delongbacteria bacterium]MBN2833796.1 MBL fold metallo-hydrolase [Candidatus Delongbacteria bacterium]
MRIDILPYNLITYSSNSYLIRGDYNQLSDVNTLIDTGGDSTVLFELRKIYTGVGKRPIEQILLTHCHFDHTGGIKILYDNFKPEVFAYSPQDPKYKKLEDNTVIKAGDSFCRVVHSPFHSSDSVCFFFEKERIIFTGDLQLFHNTNSIDYDENYLRFLQYLISFDLKIIYPGHGAPIKDSINKRLIETLEILS